MLRILPPTSAYREDLARAQGRERFAPVDALWLLAVQALEFAGGLRPVERSALYTNVAAALLAESNRQTRDPESVPYTDVLAGLANQLARASDDGADELAAWYLRLAEQITGAGANHLALAVIAHLLRIPNLQSRLLGRVLSHQGRIARNLGDLEAAEDCFGSVIALGTRTRDREIVARGLYGMAGVDLMKGNHPRGRSRYEQALRAAEDAESDELIGLAHRGLLVVHATARNFDVALHHAGAALRRAPDDPDSYAELLSNIGAVCSDAGYFGAALAAHTAAASVSRTARVRIACLGGAAAAAANLHQQSTFEALVRRIDAEITRGAPPYETAMACAEVAKALARQGDPRALRYATTARKIAGRHQYYELQFVADELMTATPPAAHPEPVRAPYPISESSSAVLSEIAALTPANSVLAKV